VCHRGLHLSRPRPRVEKVHWNEGEGCHVCFGTGDLIEFAVSAVCDWPLPACAIDDRIGTDTVSQVLGEALEH